MRYFCRLQWSSFIYLIGGFAQRSIEGLEMLANKTMVKYHKIITLGFRENKIPPGNDYTNDIVRSKINFYVEITDTGKV